MTLSAGLLLALTGCSSQDAVFACTDDVAGLITVGDNTSPIKPQSCAMRGVHPGSHVEVITNDVVTLTRDDVDVLTCIDGNPLDGPKVCGYDVPR